MFCFEYESATKAIKKQRKKKVTITKPCPDCGAHLADKPASRYQHRCRNRKCFLKIKKQHIKLVLFKILVGKIKNNFAVAHSFSEGLIHFLQITQKYYSITYLCVIIIGSV